MCDVSLASFHFAPNQVANYFLAWEANLKIIPVMNKIDLPTSGTHTRAPHLLKKIAHPNPIHAPSTLPRPDVCHADPARVIKELAIMGFEESEILKATGKTGEGVEGILKAVIERLPAYAAFRCSSGFTRDSLSLTHTHTRAYIARNRPSGDPAKPLKALLFENWYDQFRGVVCLVNILDGALKKGTNTTHPSPIPPPQCLPPPLPSPLCFP